ncbi:MAG: TolC family protein [Desulfobacteraceae bacterium]
MTRPKKYFWNCVRIFFLVALFLLCCTAVEIWAQESGNPPETASRSKSVLTLADVIDLALHANRSLISSAYGVESQALSVEVSQSEFDYKLFPQATAAATDESRRVGGGVTFEKKYTPGVITSISPQVYRLYEDDSDPAYGSQLGISLTVPLLRGFGSEINLNGVRSAQYSLRSAKRSHYLVKVNTVLEAVAAVYNIVQQRELVNLYQAQADRLEGHAVMAKAREKIGLATPIDVYRAQIRLKDAQNSLNQAQEALRSAGDRLKIVLAAPLEQAVQVVAPLVCQPVDISAPDAVETALQHRVELKQVDDDVKEAQRAARLSKNNLSAQLDLVSSYTRLGYDDAFDGLTRFSEDFWSVQLISETDWSRTAEKASYQQSRLAVRRASLSRSARIDTIKREVRQVYDALQKAQQRMQIRTDQIEQAKGKQALAKIKFGHGMADNFDLIEAETELQEARTNLLDAKVDYIVGTYRLRAALGTLIES